MRWNPFSSSARTWRWGVVYVTCLASACWMFSSCSSDGPVRRSDDPPPVRMTDYTPPAGATNVGAEMCAGCHEKEAKAYADSHHGRKNDPRTPAAKQECETCHGPGSVHAENGGGKGNIRMYGKSSSVSPAAQTAKCLECHEQMWPEWQHGKHAAREVSCTDCHSIHEGVGDHQIQTKTQPELCARCHKQVNADLARQSHHPIREGKINCTDCHSPHGTTNEKNIKANSTNELCYKCHTEKRGPFLWEHPPVMEDCLNCHTPHGSQHDKLLNTNRPFLCQRCHSNSRHPGTIYDNTTTFRGPSDTDRMFASGCVNCHSNIHGSNHPSGEFFQR